MLADNELEEKHKDALKNAIKEEVTSAKKKVEEAKEKRKKEYDAIPESVKKALNSIKKYKFYPQNKEPNLAELGLKSPFINRYYGMSDEMF